MSLWGFRWTQHRFPSIFLGKMMIGAPWVHFSMALRELGWNFVQMGVMSQNSRMGHFARVPSRKHTKTWVSCRWEWFDIQSWTMLSLIHLTGTDGNSICIHLSENSVAWFFSSESSFSRYKSMWSHFQTEVLPGVGRIGLVDADTVALSNLHRQIGHLARSVGVNKAASLAKACRELNGTVQLEVCPQRLSRLEETAELIARGDGGFGGSVLWGCGHGVMAGFHWRCLLVF